MQFKGVSRRDEIKPLQRRKDTRWLGHRLSDFLKSVDGIFITLVSLPFLAIVTVPLVPLAGEFVLVLGWFYIRFYVRNKKRLYDFPWRVPKLADVYDGSKPGQKKGAGITYLGYDTETRQQIYADNVDMRAHMLVLGTTGSGKTELLLGIGANAIAQNTGFIYIDGKGDPKLMKDIFRLARGAGREDDLLVINFITSGRDFVEKQSDKMTNTLNIMGNTSSGMLIETIVALMDSSGGNTDMWKGRAISFVAALTRPLVFLRDKGFMNLSPEKYLEYFELIVIEDLVWNHNGRYGDLFDVIVAPLRAYLLTLPGYNRMNLKKQDAKTLEQHGYITMQLTRIFNDLTFNYGHIFGIKVGEIDFFDVVLNRRILIALLPALERSTDSMAMLGKLIVGSIKQMMAGCLGNRVEGTVREIIDSRPTNASTPYYVILDEYGYYTVVGFAVAPAQARSLGFSMIFAAQDFSSLQKSSKEEADATWENTGIRAIGRLSSGRESETFRRVSGAAGKALEAVMTGYERRMGLTREVFKSQDHVHIEERDRIDYDDLASQADGAFTYIVGKYEQGGETGGVRVVHGMSFYVGGDVTPQRMRINDLLPIEPPEPSDLPQNRKNEEALRKSIEDGSFTALVNNAIKADPVLASMHNGFEHNHIDPGRPRLGRHDAALAMLGWFISDRASIPPAASRRDSGDAGTTRSPGQIPAEAVAAASIEAVRPALSEAGSKALLDAAMRVCAQDDETAIRTDNGTANLISSTSDTDAFRKKALVPLRQYRYRPGEDESGENRQEEMPVADLGKLMAIEMLARGKPFANLQEKWAARDRLDDVRAAIARETSYIEQPPSPPTKLDIDQLQQKLNVFEDICKELLKPASRGN